VEGDWEIKGIIKGFQLREHARLQEHIRLLEDERERRANRDRPLTEAALRYEEAWTRFHTLPGEAPLRTWSYAQAELERSHNALIMAATVYVTENENLAKALKLPRGTSKEESDESTSS
jgi:hypothetical protein